MSSFGQALLDRYIVTSSLRLALVVGMLLNVINQGAVFLSGRDISWSQAILNFEVPFCVASYSAAKIEIERNKTE